MSHTFIIDSEKLKSPQLVVNTVDFNNQDLADFVNLSEEIDRNGRERRSYRKRDKARSKTTVVGLNRTESFEAPAINNDKFLQAMEHETSYDTEKYHLVNSLENLMEFFDKNVNKSHDSPVNGSTFKQFALGKVASAVASLRNKCGLAGSTVTKRTTTRRKSEVKASILELKKIYETSTEIEASPSPKGLKFKSPMMSRKTQVKQIAFLFNNKISSLKKKSSVESLTTETILSDRESSIALPTFTSTLKPKSPNMKAQVPSLVTNLPSPFFKRKQLKKSASNNSLAAATPLTKRKQLQKQRSTTCLVAESVYSQLSVKDKALLYNKFIADMSNQNPKLSKHAEVLQTKVKKEKQNGEVVFERQGSVKYLRDRLEAKLIANKKLSQTLNRFKRSNSKLSLNVKPKSKEYEDILKSDISKEHFKDDDDDDDLLHVSSLTVFLKPRPESKKSNGKNKKRGKGKKTDPSFFENVNLIEASSHKRTQSMLRAAFCVEPLAPPKKARRTRHDESFDSDTIFPNKELEELFYQWLKEKNGVDFDITSRVHDKKNLIEIIPKNKTDNNVLPPQEDGVKIFEAAVINLEAYNQEEELKAETDNSSDGMELIKNAMENKEVQNQEIIEVELPPEVQTTNESSKGIATDKSDLALAGITKTTSEDSHEKPNSPEQLKSLENTNVMEKLLRKKKSRRCFSLAKENAASNLLFTDSDSDNKAKELKFQSCTLPKTTKCSKHINEMIIKTCSSKSPSEQTYQLTNDMFEGALTTQVNSPNKINSAQTLTVLSSPSPASEAQLKETCRSWPTLLEPSLESGDTNLVKCRFSNTEYVNVQNGIMEKEKCQILMDTFIDQGFETGSNSTDSPFKLLKKTNSDDLNKLLIKEENPTTCSTPFENKTSAAEHPNISPITANSKTARSDFLTTTTIKGDPKKKKACEIKNSTVNKCSINRSDKFVSHDSAKSPLRFKQNNRSSQFWITSGNFTAAININYCEPKELRVLSNVFSEKSLQSNEMNFGIDEQKFCFDSSAISDEIIFDLPKENNCSNYWFSTGNFITPFTGKPMSTKNVQGFFNYVREFLEESGSLKFGIDDYEFSNIYRKIPNSINPISGLDNSANSSVSDQSDIDSQGSLSDINSSSDLFNTCEPSSTSGNQSKKKQSDKVVTVADALKILQKKQSELKLLEESLSISSKTNSGKQKLVNLAESAEYMRKFRSIIKLIEFIGSNNGFNVCTLDELQSCMLHLSRYSDMSYATSHALIENILNLVMYRR